MSTTGDQTTPFDFEAHRLKTIAEYQRVRPLYVGVAAVVKKIFEEACDVRDV